MAIQLGDDDAPDVHHFPEGLGLIEAGLTDMRVHDEDDVVGRHHLQTILYEDDNAVWSYFC